MADISNISKINSAISKMDFASNTKNANKNKLKDITSIAEKVSKINQNKNKIQNSNFLSTQAKHATELFNNMSKISKNLVNQTKQFTITSLKNLKDISSSSLKAVGRISSELANEIKDSIGFNKQGFFTTLFARINPVIGYAIGKIISTDTFKNLIGKLKDKVIESFSYIHKKISGVFTKMWDGMVSRSKSIYSYVKSFFVKDNKEIKKKTKTVRNITPQIKKKVPKLAKGGLIGKDGLAYVHSAEVVGSMDQIKKDIQSAVGISVKKSWNPITTLFREAKGEKNFYKDQPWQHILIREIKEMREAIIDREGKWTVAWKKMLDQHPIFKGMIKTIKALLNPIKTLSKGFGLIKKSFGILTYPIRALFRKKGVGYESDVKGKTQNQILGMIFSNEMSRLDKMVLLSTDIKNAIFDLTQYTTGKKMKGATAKKEDNRNIMKKALDFIVSPITKRLKGRKRAGEIKKLLREGGSHEELLAAQEELNDPKNKILRKRFNRRTINDVFNDTIYSGKKGWEKLESKFFNVDLNQDKLNKLNTSVEESSVKENIPLRNLNEIGNDQLIEIKKLIEISGEIRDNAKCSCVSEEKILKFISNGRPITSFSSPLQSKRGGKSFKPTIVVEDKKLGKIINIENIRNAAKDKKQNKLFTYIGDSIDGVKGAVKKSGKGLMRYLMLGLGSIGSIFGSTVGSIGGLIGSGMSSLVTGLGGLGSLLFSSLGSLGGLLGNSISSVVKNLGTSITALGASLFTKIKSLFNPEQDDDLDFDLDGKKKKEKLNLIKILLKKEVFGNLYLVRILI